MREKQDYTLPKKGPTMKDVAKKAGVSLSTVSRSINSPHELKQETLMVVRKAMKELNFSANEIARSLKNRKSQTIGIIIPNILNPFFARIVRSAEHYLFENKYTPIIYDSEEDAVKEEKYLQSLLERRVDGVLFVPSKENKRIPEFIKQKSIPTVFIDRYFSKDFDFVKGNNYSGIALIISFLVSRGYEKIGMIAGSQETVSGKERYLAFLKAITMHNLKVEKKYVKFGSYSIESGYFRMNELLNTGEYPEVIISANNFIGIGAFQAIKERGYKIPDDIGIVIYDEVYLADFVDPPLTVVVQPAEELGRSAAELLLERIDSQGILPPRELVIEPKLIVRNSTK